MLSLAKRILEEINKNPYTSTKKICENLQIPYTKYRNYVYKIRSYLKIGLGSNRPNTEISFHAIRFYGYALKSTEREKALRLGWTLSKSRNRVLLWKDLYGRIEWFETGRVVAWVRRPANQGRLFQLLCNAFSFTGLIRKKRELDLFLKAFTLKGAHLVQDVGAPLPYAKNDLLKDQLGVIVKLGDKSHRKGLEIEFCLPNWAEEFKVLTFQNILAFKNFNELFLGFGEAFRGLSDPKAPRKDFDKGNPFIS